MASLAANEKGKGSSEGEVIEVKLKLMRPGSREAEDMPLNIDLSLTVADLRSQIQKEAVGIPSVSSLRLIYAGRQLADDTTLKDAFRVGLESSSPINLYVVIRPDQNSPRATNTPARGFFSSQPSSSSSSSRSGVPSQPTPQQPQPTPTTSQGQAPNLAARRPHGLSPAVASLLQGLQGDAQVISYNRQVTITTTGHIIRPNRGHTQNGRTNGADGESVENPTAAMNQSIDGTDIASGSQATPQASGTNQAPTNSGSRIHPGLGGPDSMLESLANNFMRANSYTRRAVHTQTHTIRFNTQTRPGTFDMRPNLNTLGTSGNSTLNDVSALAPPPPQQYYLLQGPNGESSILLSPIPPIAPWNPFSVPPPSLRPPLAPIGSHMPPPPGLNLNENLSTETNNTENSRPPEPRQGGQLQDAARENMQLLFEAQEVRRRLIQALNQNMQQGTGPLPGSVQPPAQRTFLNRFLEFLLRFIGGNTQVAPEMAIEQILNWVVENTWLALKLAFGVYLLGGGRDPRRDMVLWTAAVVIFFVQSGLFAVHMQPLLNRMNAFVPDPNRIVPQLRQPDQQQQQAAPGAPDPRPLDPQQLADRLIQQHNNRQNGLWDNIQASVSIFVASLVPGLGERVGNAQAAQDELRRQALEQAAQAAGGGQNGDVAQQGDGAQNEDGNGGPPPADPLENQEADVQGLFGL